MSEDYTNIPGITRLTDDVLDEQIPNNLVSFFNWALLNKGGFINILRPYSKSKFKAVTTPGHTVGAVWESTVGNFVWETGLSYTVTPTPIVGIYVNGTFVAINSGYHIDYLHGQIIFDSPIDPTSIVEMEFSYRYYNFYDSHSEWFQQVVFDPLPESGLRDILAANRVYLPAVIIETVADTTLTPLQMGDVSVIEDQTVLFHVIGETAKDVSKMVYILKRLYQKSIWLYDTNAIAVANKFPLNVNGSVKNDALMYPDLVNRFGFKRCIFKDVRPQEITSKLPLFRAVVRVTLELYVV